MAVLALVRGGRGSRLAGRGRGCWAVAVAVGPWPWRSGRGRGGRAVAVAVGPWPWRSDPMMLAALALALIDRALRCAGALPALARAQPQRALASFKDKPTCSA